MPEARWKARRRRASSSSAARSSPSPRRDRGTAIAFTGAPASPPRARRTRVRQQRLRRTSLSLCASYIATHTTAARGSAVWHRCAAGYAAAGADLVCGLGVPSSATATNRRVRNRRASGGTAGTWSAFSLGITLVFAGRSHFTQPGKFKADLSSHRHLGLLGAPRLVGFPRRLDGRRRDPRWRGLLASCAQRVASAPSSSRASCRSPRAALLILTVTPANIYMFTHGAIMPGVIEGELPLNWHAGRFIAAIIVLVSAHAVRARAGEWTSPRRTPRRAVPGRCACG